MSELLKDTWETKGPISKKIKERIKKADLVSKALRK